MTAAEQTVVHALEAARDRFNRIRRAIYADEMAAMAKEGAIEATTALSALTGTDTPAREPKP